MKHLVWFRVDLRIEDHPALDAARRAGGEVIALYAVTPTTWKYHEMAECKIDFIQRNLRCLASRLQSLGIDLHCVEMDSYDNTPPQFIEFCKHNQISHVYFNQQYEIDERRRDEAVTQHCQAAGIEVQTFQEQVFIQPGMVLSAVNLPLQKFTPFKRRWIAFADQLGFDKPQCPVSLNLPEQEQAQLWPAGEAEAWRRLQHFLTEHAAEYDEWRDFPARSGTSTLSPYLALGVISIRQVLYALHAAAGTTSFGELIQSKGYGTWLNELIWREFYKHILLLFPKVACGQTLQARFKVWPWRQDEAQFKLWCEGKTGYPLIDAAMRQLNQTGWMHNRLRMNVAVFLAKFLKIDWRWGESYFSRHLIDGDLSANNGGWQWCAGTGTDAMPYFRMFNPTLQAQKFDPEGTFIRQYCPELRHLDNKNIHLPQPHALEKYHAS